MKCPIFELGYILALTVKSERMDTNCIEEECAWYDQEYCHCAILCIASIADCLRDILRNKDGE